MPVKDALTDALAEQVARHITAGDWTVYVVAGGLALDKSGKAFLRGFEIEATDQTVVIVCEREKK